MVERAVSILGLELVDALKEQQRVISAEVFGGDELVEGSSGVDQAPETHLFGHEEPLLFSDPHFGAVTGVGISL
jgi:hypothetical protein